MVFFGNRVGKINGVFGLSFLGNSILNPIVSPHYKGALSQNQLDSIYKKHHNQLLNEENSIRDFLKKNQGTKSKNLQLVQWQSPAGGFCYKNSRIGIKSKKLETYLKSPKRNQMNISSQERNIYIR